MTAEPLDPDPMPEWEKNLLLEQEVDRLTAQLRATEAAHALQAERFDTIGWHEADRLTVALAERDAQLGECTCVTAGPDVDGPDETCPRHGRSYADWVERGDVLQSRLAERDAQIAAVRALLPEVPDPIYDAENGGSFEGFEGGPDHRTVGEHRAWCYDANEWCYPSTPCRFCLPPIEVAELIVALGGAE